jgi:hypothetical protein
LGDTQFGSGFGKASELHDSSEIQKLAILHDHSRLVEDDKGTAFSSYISFVLVRQQVP